MQQLLLTSRKDHKLHCYCKARAQIVQYYSRKWDCFYVTPYNNYDKTTDIHVCTVHIPFNILNVKRMKIEKVAV